MGAELILIMQSWHKLVGIPGSSGVQVGGWRTARHKIENKHLTQPSQPASRSVNLCSHSFFPSNLVLVEVMRGLRKLLIILTFNFTAKQIYPPIKKYNNMPISFYTVQK